MIVLFIGMIPMRTVELYDIPTEKIFRIIVVETQSQMNYSYTHSVSRTPIIEHMKLSEESELITYRVDYKDQSGAGLPEYASEGAVFREEDGWFVIDGLTRSYRSHQIHVNELYNNSLEIEGETIKLYDYYEEKKGLIGIKVKKIPLALFYFKLGISTL